MSLETAAIAAGKALGNHLARAWLAARTQEQEGGRELVELVKARFPDRIARRRFERQVADIADQVADRLLTLCGHEYGGLSKGDKAAALQEVVRTLTQADMSDQALFAADMDPARLARQVREGLSALSNSELEFELGEAGARLYDIVLDECCDCFVRIVRELPQFGPRASVETMSRLSAVADQVSLLLARLPPRSLDAPEGTATDDAFRHRYLEHISRTLDVLELFGVRTERYRPRTTLSVAYISLNVSGGGHSSEQARSARRMIGVDEWRKSDGGEATQRVETALGHASLTLIRGEAGSGKTTLLNWLAISAARRTFTADLADWNGLVPFLIKLRSLRDGVLPPPEEFLKGVAGPIAGLTPKGWVHRQLESGRVLLLVDGVDELPSAQRRAVRPWLSNLIAQYPRMRVVITSRPAAAGADWLSAEGFATAFLERMTPSDVRELIRHWHQAVRDAVDLPCEPEHLPAFESSLLARLEAAPHLRSLAGSPLLASMLCALNLDRERQLPRDRMGLYAAALEMLLERRDVERQIAADSVVVLERAQKVQVLQDLAWRLSVTGRSELPKSAVLQWVSDKLKTMPNAPDDGAAVLDYLLERSGILREPVVGRIDFVHRTVQEYLTAKQFADDGDLEPLIAQAHKDQWRETIIMAAGHANAPQRQEIVSGLLRRIAAEPSVARRLKLVLAGCTETLQTIPSTLQQSVENCISDLIPPRDANSARSLSGVGETLLSRLPSSLDGLTTAAARAVVRTAWLINGPDAIDVLARYSMDPRPEVQQELLNAWAYFDPELYAKKVLADAPISKHFVQITTPGTLSASRYLTNLRRLSITKEVGLTNLSFLEKLDQPIEWMVLDGTFSNLGRIQKYAATLEYVAVTTSSRLSDLTALTRLPKLNVLNLNVNGVEDLAFVSQLPELASLTLFNLKNITDFSPLRRHEKLETLTLGECEHLAHLASLPPLEYITSLSISASQLTTLDGLASNAPLLRYLYLFSSTRITDFHSLNTLNLGHLSLWSCTGITDFAPLAQFPELSYLDLENTKIQDLTPLSSLSELETLWIRDCPGVSDLAPLRGLTKLRKIYLRGIADGTDLEPLAANRRVKVYAERGQRLRNHELLGRRLEW